MHLGIGWLRFHKKSKCTEKRKTREIRSDAFMCWHQQDHWDFPDLLHGFEQKNDIMAKWALRLDRTSRSKLSPLKLLRLPEVEVFSKPINWAFWPGFWSIRLKRSHANCKIGVGFCWLIGSICWEVGDPRVEVHDDALALVGFWLTGW